MTDTEVTLSAKGCDPSLERLMIEAGESPESVRLLTRKRRTGRGQAIGD